MEYEFSYHCDVLGIDMYSYRGYAMPLEHVKLCESDERYWRTKYETMYAKNLTDVQDYWVLDKEEGRRRTYISKKRNTIISGEVFVGLDGVEYLIFDK